MPLIDYITGTLQTETFYHLYNRANGFGRCFYNRENYSYFLRKHFKYSKGFFETWAYCLLPNHFHFLIRTYDTERIVLEADRREIRPGVTFARHLYMVRKIELADVNRLRSRELENLIERDTEVRRIWASWVLNEQLRRHFLGYAKAINKQQKRYGSLMQSPFRRKVIPEADLQRVIIYIHRNPLHHGYTDDLSDYDWSSYHHVMTGSNKWLKSGAVLQLFDGVSGFKQMHMLAQDQWEEFAHRATY